MGNKATGAEVDFRVNQIVKMFLQGITQRAVILEYCKENWGIGSDSVDNTYLPRAREIYKEIAKYEAEVQLGLSIARLNDLYSRNLKIQDYKAALATQKEINELLGIKSAVKTDIKMSGEIQLPQVNLNINSGGNKLANNENDVES